MHADELQRLATGRRGAWTKHSWIFSQDNANSRPCRPSHRQRRGPGKASGRRQLPPPMPPTLARFLPQPLTLLPVLLLLLHNLGIVHEQRL